MLDTDYRYTIDDVAELFNVTRETVRRWCRERRIDYIKLPGEKGEYRFSKNDVEKFIAKLNMKAAVKFPKYPKQTEPSEEKPNEEK